MLDSVQARQSDDFVTSANGTANFLQTSLHHKLRRGDS